MIRLLHVKKDNARGIFAWQVCRKRMDKHTLDEKMAGVHNAGENDSEGRKMGTIVIEQYGSLGSAANRDAPIADLKSLLDTNVDATTSTTAENITLNIGTRVVTIYAVEDHRVSVASSDASTRYAFVAAGTYRDFGAEPGSILYYKANA